MLPKLSAPIYELKLPILNKTIQFRSFLVKEQKILLMANESGEESDKFLFNNIKQIIKNCCITPIDVDNLSIVDIEYFFINLRARSVGEIIDIKYRCENTLEEGTLCGNIIDVQYNILDVDIENMDKFQTKIALTDEIGIMMKFPSYDSVGHLNPKSSDDMMFEVIKSCIDYIYDANEIYSIKDASKQEIDEFIDSLNVTQLNLIKDFFQNMPSVKKDIEFVCPKCGYNHQMTIRGLTNFFG